MQSKEQSINRVVTYICQNFRFDIKTKDMAKVMGMSEFHFYRIFKKETGFTPQKYLEKTRLEYAKHLAYLNPSISKIHLAFECGYSSPTSFNRAFKRYFKTNPTEYLETEKNPILKYLENELPEKRLPLQEASFEITYLPQINLTTRLTTPEKHCIEQELQHRDYGKYFGVYLDAPTHHPIEECRYLIGCISATSQKGDYVLESGYYVKFKIKGDILKWAGFMLKTKEELDKMGYEFREPIGFEEFNYSDNSFDYFTINRTIFIRVFKKNK